jgi:hypothetical protein
MIPDPTIDTRHSVPPSPVAATAFHYIPVLALYLIAPGGSMACALTTKERAVGGHHRPGEDRTVRQRPRFLALEPPDFLGRKGISSAQNAPLRMRDNALRRHYKRDFRPLVPLFHRLSLPGFGMGAGGRTGYNGVWSLGVAQVRA